MDIKECLSVLGLEKITTIDEILSKSKELRISLQNTESSEELIKLGKIIDATNMLIRHIKRKRNEQSLSDRNPTIVDNTNNVFKKIRRFFSNFDIKKINKKRVLIASYVFVISTLTIVPLGIYLNYEAEQKQIYNDFINLEEMMMDFSYENQYTIEEYINKLPYDYRDVSTKKIEFQMIRSGLDEIGGYLVVPQYWTLQTSQRVRNAVFNLIDLDTSLYAWDLTNVTNKYNRGFEQRIMMSNITWRAGNYTLSYNAGPDSGMTLTTNLPNQKSLSKSYYFYTEYSASGEIFGYVNQINATDKFYAYRINNVQKNSINLYCYSNQQTYNMIM
jgi:hypothetical protein